MRRFRARPRRIEASCPGALSTGVHRAVQQGLAAARMRFEESAMRVQPGARIADRFVVIEELGRGGFGRVYKARDEALFGRPVAVKLLHERRLLTASAEEAERFFQSFEQEARVIAQLRHHHILILHDFGTWQTRPGRRLPYLVTELHEGCTLADRLESPLPIEEALDIVEQLLAALAHAHACGVMHLDIKPSNLFLESDGHLRVIDFGLARLLGRAPDAARYNIPLPYAGTHAYLPWEQRQGEKRNQQSDLFAAATVLLESISGERPEVEVNQPLPLSVETTDSWPPSLINLLQKARDPDPSTRFHSATEMLAAVRTVREQLHGRVMPNLEPYRHLAMFQAEHASVFFGRERLSILLRRRLDDTPLLLLVGASGAGKSSLARAGLLPRLAPGWSSLVMEPGRQPMTTLLFRLRSCGNSDLGGLAAAQAMENPALLGQALRSAAAPGRRLVLIVDQLEECFTQVENKRERLAFLSALLLAADDPSSSVRVLLLIREDFLSCLAEVPELLRRASARPFYVGPPDEGDLLAALVQPAAQQGFAFEPGLPERILAELLQENAPLPLLQLLASKLWEGRDISRQLLTFRTYDVLGGASGLLAAHADSVIAGLDNEELRTSALDVCNTLVTEEGTRDTLERAKLVDQLGGSTAVVLDALVKGRLIQTLRRDGKEMVELAHDSLISRWPALQNWAHQDQVLRRLRQKLARDTALWLGKNRSSLLLLHGAQLDEALIEYRRQRLVCSAEVAEFLTCSQRWRRRRQRIATIAAVSGTLLLVMIALFSWFRLQTEKRLVAERDTAIMNRNQLITNRNQLLRDAEQNGRVLATTVQTLESTNQALGAAQQLSDKRLHGMTKLAVEEKKQRLKVLDAQAALEEKGQLAQLNEDIAIKRATEIDNTNKLLERANEIPSKAERISRAGRHAEALYSLLNFVGSLRERALTVGTPLISGLAVALARAPSSGHIAAASVSGAANVRTAVWGDRKAIYWSAGTGVVRHELETGHTRQLLASTGRPVSGLAISPDERALLIEKEDGELSVLELDKGLGPRVLSQNLVHSQEATIALRLDNSFNIEILLRGRQSVLIRRVGPGQATPTDESVSWTHPISAAFFVEAGQELFTGSPYGHVAKLQGGYSQIQYGDVSREVETVTALAASATKVAAGDAGGWIRIWNVNGDFYAHFRDAVHHGIRQISFSPTDERLLVVGHDYRIRIFDYSLQALIRSACANWRQLDRAQEPPSACLH